MPSVGARVSSRTGTPCAGTVATRSYRARAKSVAQSFLKAHPDGRFFILTVDGTASAEPIDGIEWLGPEHLRLPHLFELQLRYTPVELCCALKVSLAREALERYPESPFLYLDSDMFVYRKLDEIWDLSSRASIVVVPHWLGIVDRSPLFEYEREFLECGVFNAGCFAVRSGSEASCFLLWMEERVRFDSRLRPGEGLFFDQKWFDLVPSIFSEAAILRDPAYDVAYWNLFERKLAKEQTGYSVAGKPLAIFHFSGLKLPEQRIVPFKPIHLDFEEGSSLRQLVEEYTQLQRELGDERESRIPYHYPSFENGVPANHVFHVLYRSLSSSQSLRLGNPFRTSRKSSFFEWATSARAPSRISPYFETLYGLRPDLQRAFPDVSGRNREEFLRWSLTAGAGEGGFDAVALRVPELLGLDSADSKRPWSSRVAGPARKIMAKLLGRRTRDDGEIYPADFFLELEDLQSAGYPVMAESIRSLFEPTSIVDLGCGAGGLLAAMRDEGIRDCLGLEFSSQGLRLCRERGLNARFADLSKPYRFRRRFDLALCLEVAEHLAPESAPQIVENLTRAAPRLIFSAARPGQGGHDHRNERPREYWIALLAAQGFVLEKELSRRLRRAWLVPEVAQWFSNNVLVFHREKTG
jgi:SAM-dependent methyltransferase